MRAYSEKITIIAGNAHPTLAQAISRHLSIPLAAAQVGRFPDGEIDIKVNDDLRGTDCFVIQPTCPPVNENWIELLLLLDCLRRSSAGRVTAVMPYYGYARKDRKDEGRVPISAKVVANTLIGCGADRVLALDMHAAQIQGFFDIPVDHMYAKPALLGAVRRLGLDKPVVVSPDVGGIKMARAYAKRLGAELALVDKRRPKADSVEVMNIIGDVEGKNVVMFDDVVTTARTLCQAAAAIRKQGAKDIYAGVTHGVFCPGALERIEESPIKEVVVTDTIRHDPGSLGNKVKERSVAGLLGEAVQRIHEERSLSTLFV